MSTPLFHHSNHQINYTTQNGHYNENYDNFKSTQQFANKDWKQIQSFNCFNSASNDPSCSNRFENVQNSSGPYIYQQQQQISPDLTMLIQSNSFMSSNDGSNFLIRDEKDSLRRVKKSRVLFSQWQINELEKLFKKQKYVTSNEREIVSKRLRLNPNQVKIWFQNRRYKIKKKNN